MKISVIMGIYNCESTLRESIDSILNQTYKDWEMIMCDDGSIDNTLKIAKEYEKKYTEKFVVLQNDTNRGLNYTLNKCLKKAKGEYIARMDGDDISEISRFEKQVEILEKNKDIGIVSSDMVYFDEKGVWGKSNTLERPEKKDFINGTQFCHAPAMVRKEAYELVNGYSEEEEYLRVEDYHLWVKMYEKGVKGINLKEVLYRMRDDKNAISRRKFKHRINESKVRLYVYKKFNVSRVNAIYIVRPIIVGILPDYIYKLIRKLKRMQ